MVACPPASGGGGLQGLFARRGKNARGQAGRPGAGAGRERRKRHGLAARHGPPEAPDPAPAASRTGHRRGGAASCIASICYFKVLTPKKGFDNKSYGNILPLISKTYSGFVYISKTAAEAHI